MAAFCGGVLLLGGIYAVIARRSPPPTSGLLPTASIKISTFLLASPDEVAAALIDGNNRKQWEIGLTGASLGDEGLLHVSYGDFFKERLKYEFFTDQARTTFLVHEQVNN